MTSIKYIGMDVHTESTSIAVRNSIGKIVMECVVETKASTLLQFLDGLRGDLRVVFEEGTWATWLYDLLKPHVTEVLVCNTRKNAVRNGSKSDRIDARQAVRTVVHEQRQVGVSRRARLAHDEGVGPQLFNHHQGSHTGHESTQGVVSQLGHSVCGQRGVCTTLPCGVARQDQRSGRAATRRTLLSATGCFAALAPGSAAGSVDRKPEAQNMEIVAPDSSDRSDPGGHFDRGDADSAPLPHQAQPVDLQRSGAGNL